MKRLLIFATLLSSTTALAVDEFELERMQRSCELERNSLLRARKGTPSCIRLNQLNQLQREQATHRIRQYSQSQGRIAATPQRVIYTNQRNGSTQQSGGYHWNATRGRYCDHDRDGYATRCY